MPQGDTLQRFIFEHSPVRGEIVHLDATWQAVLERHDYPPVLRNLLGELMAASALLAATLKFTGAMVMQIQGNGPVKLLVVECNSDMTLRATAKWDGELLAGTLRTLIGDGRFAITLDPQNGKQAYQGIVSLEGETVASILEHYMQSSEQLQTRLWLAADNKRASGMLLQKLPDTESEDRDAWDRAESLTSTITVGELMTLSNEELLHRLYHEETVRVFETEPVSFRCTCSHEKVGGMLRMMGLDEVHSIIAERGTIDVNCEFCNRHYSFDQVDAEQLFAASVVSSPGSTRH